MLGWTGLSDGRIRTPIEKTRYWESRAAGLEHVPLIVGGIVPPSDAERLKAAGVAAVYTPKDFEINSILRAVVQEVEARFDAVSMGRR